MQSLTVVQPHEVRSRLLDLGLDEDVVWEAVRRSELAFRNATANHPPLFAGFVAWAEAVRGLRDRLVPRGWRKCDDGNCSLCVRPDEALAIAVATGDEGTGRCDAMPTTKSPKGPSTHEAIAFNQLQYGLFSGSSVVPITKASDDILRTTWLLLVYRNGSEVRCELSLPLSVSSDGRPYGWRERIILGTFREGPEVDDDNASDEAPNLVIEIKRKT